MAVSPEDLLSMSIFLPNLKTQNKIAKMLSLYDKKINIEETCLNKFVTLKKSLLQQMFI